MKKILYSVFLMMLVVVFAACSQASDEPKESSAGKEKEEKKTDELPNVAFVYIGVPGDGGWTHEHEKARLMLDEIANVITGKMGRGVTVINGRGYFTKEDKDVLYCVVGRNELVRLKSFIHTIDPHAFVSIIDVRDVAGEGFTLDDKKQPIH